MMKIPFTAFCDIVIFLLSFNAAFAGEVPGRDDIKVYIFLSDECIISQYYSLPLREMHEEFADEKTEFIGLFPNFRSKPKKIAGFKEKYKIPFDLKPDYYKTLTEKFNATVTPEVIVFNESKNQIIYRGRIDDAYARVGKRKRFPRTSELKDVLQALKNNEPIKTKETEPIGCFIHMKKPTD